MPAHVFNQTYTSQQPNPPVRVQQNQHYSLHPQTPPYKAAAEAYRAQHRNGREPGTAPSGAERPTSSGTSLSRDPNVVYGDQRKPLSEYKAQTSMMSFASPSKRPSTAKINGEGVSQRSSNRLTKTPPASQRSERSKSIAIPTYAPPARSSEAAPKIDSSDLFDFGPPVSFDDLHAALSKTANDSSGVPTSRPLRLQTEPAARPIGSQRSVPGTFPQQSSSSLIPSQPISGSMRQPPSSFSVHSSVGLGVNGSSSQANSSTRRQSNFTHAASKSPQLARDTRKSMGAVATRDLSQSGSQRKRPGLAAKIASSAANSPSGALSPSSEMQSLEDLTKPLGSANLHPGYSQPSSATRSSFPLPDSERTNSFRSSRGQTPASTRSKPPGSPYISGAGTQGKSPTDRSSGQVLSTSPHASGLGARTISPTDLAILRRLSTVNLPPPVPNTPPTPLPEFRSRPSSSYSSVNFVHNAPTPVSSRATPDMNRKSYLSNAASSSTSNLPLGNRNSQSSLHSRLSQSIPISRLPTPKLRTGNTPAPEKDVPPVPAIPRAYDSPREMASFTSLEESTFASKPDISETATSSAFNLSEKRVNHTSMQPGSRLIRGRGSTVNSEAVKSALLSTDLSTKEALRPLRLPPLRLAPLDDLPNRMTRPKKQEADSSSSHAPTVRHVSPVWQTKQRTPSTPMTASKAFDNPRSMLPPASLPRAHSIYDVALPLSATEAEPHNRFGDLDMQATRPNGYRNTINPYDTSQARPSGESSRLQTQKGVDLFKDGDSDRRRRTIIGPRSFNVSKSRGADEAASSTTDLTPPQRQESPRRQTSFNWRKVGRKSPPPATPVDQTSFPPPPDYTEMPPPRLPASATWNGSMAQAAAGIDPSRLAGLKAPRAPAAPIANGHTRIPSGNLSTVLGQSTVRAVDSSQAPTPGSEKKKPRQSSIYAQHVAGTTSKSSLATVSKAQSIEASFDGDDQLAEEEMFKLGSSLKDQARAAAELDALRMRAVPVRAMSAGEARASQNLNMFEHGEVTDYRDIYFTGRPNASKRIGDMTSQQVGAGYDDERGDYIIVAGDHLAYRYEVVGLLGKGSFGQVVKCVDHKQGRLVAVKIIRNKKRFHQQALVEVNILQKLREWDPHGKNSMVKFTQSFYFRGHLCISTELLDINLYELIKAHDFRGFSVRLIRRFTKQMLSSLVLLKSKRVIHCDLKPENILLAHPLKAEIKTIDFGSSCFENEKVYTYIQSRFYRSPEVILGMSYGLPIDMWSLGCILAELYTGYPVFPGENEQEQLACIMEVLGPPERHLIERSTRKKLFFDSMGKPRMTVSSKGKRRRPSSKTLSQALKCDDEIFIDFLGRCLRWDPERRMKPDEAMKHDFITGLNKKPAASRSSNAARVGQTDSPMKRSNNFAHLQSTNSSSSSLRPLPDVPTLNTKPVSNGIKGAAGGAAPSPSKIATIPGSASNRRLSVAGLPSSASLVPISGGTKRASNGAALSSNYSRNPSTQRLPALSRTGTGDSGNSMAAAAGIAAMNLGAKRAA